MSRTIQMMNEDGTPFYANLNATYSGSISLSEAFQLVDSLKSMLAFNRDVLTSGKDLGDMDRVLINMNSDLTARIADLERTIDHDKYEQWAAVAPAWAIRAGAR